MEEYIKRKDLEKWLILKIPEGEIAFDHFYGNSLSYWECACGIKRPRHGACDCEVCGELDLPDGISGNI